MKKMVNVFDYAPDICKAMPGGILLTTKLGEKVNTMTIGWGMLGIEWGKPIFVALVRESRHTRTTLDGNREFTVNIPYGEVDKKILGYCGSRSGANVDKIRELGLTLEEPVSVNVPGIREFLTLECEVVYTQKQDLSAIPAESQEKFYPYSDNGQDVHIAYYGEIVNAYLIID